MNKEEAKNEIIKRVVVSEQKITLAKAYIFNLKHHEEYEVTKLADQFAMGQGHTKPTEILLRANEDLDVSLTRAADYFADVLGFVEAIWLLVYEGVLWYFEPLTEIDTHLGWSTVIAGSGSRGGFQFEKLRANAPHKFVFAPSYRLEARKTLFDPNLFLIEAGVQGAADSEVIEAIRDAINCFRKELYRPAVVLLGKAMEGAWIELGISLVEAVPDKSGFNKGKFLETMKDDTPLMRKIDKILQLYQNRDVIGDIPSNSGIRFEELKSIFIWSDILREARNSIHFGVKPIIPNTYEKVASSVSSCRILA